MTAIQEVPQINGNTFRAVVEALITKGKNGAGKFVKEGTGLATQGEGIYIITFQT